MIENYTKPQSEVKQIRATTPEAPAKKINPFIVGPQYQLARYTVASERNNMLGVEFTTSEFDVSYEDLESGNIVDKDFVKLYGENLEAVLATFADDDTNHFRVAAVDEPHKIRLNNAGTGVALNSYSLFSGRDVTPGDIVEISYGGETRKRTVVGIEKEENASSVGTPAGASTNPVTSTAAFTDVTSSGWAISVDDMQNWDGLVEGSKLGNQYGERYTITVTTGGAAGTAEVRIRSASGLFSADNVATVDGGAGDFDITDASLGGLTVTLSPDTGTPPLQVGETFVFTIVGDYTAPSDSEITVTGTYTGTQDTTYVVKVIEGIADGTGSVTGAKVKVYDLNGVDVTKEITITEGTSYSLGSNGLYFSIDSANSDNGGLRTGDAWTIAATAAAKNGTESIVVLNGAAVDTSDWLEADLASNTLNVEFRLAWSGELDARRNEAPNESWSAGNTAVTVNADLSLQVAERTSEWVPFKDAIGRVFASYRALVPAGVNEKVIKVVSLDDITSNFGVIDPDNTLAYGVYIAYNAAAGETVYAARVPSDDADGYTTVLTKASNYNNLYALSLLNYSSDVLELVKTHVTENSTSTKKHWRKAYMGAKNPGKYESVTTADGSSSNCNATVSTFNGSLVRVTTNDVDLVSAGVTAGDLFRINYETDDWGDSVYEEYEILRVNSIGELILKTPLSSAIGTPQKFEIWKPDTGSSQAQYMGALGESTDTDRVILVWSDSPTNVVDGETITVEPMFLACEVAGLRAALLPQQGLTMYEIESATEASLMFTKYSEEDLDYAASRGIFIITQEVEDGPVFIRHQLTTETDKGLLYYEDSLGTNIDNISYAIEDFIKQYIGKRNTTRNTINEIRNRYEDLLLSFTEEPRVLNGSQIGPAIENIVEGSLFVRIHPTLRDHIELGSEAELPSPINRATVYQFYSTT